MIIFMAESPSVRPTVQRTCSSNEGNRNQNRPDQHAPNQRPAPLRALGTVRSHSNGHRNRAWRRGQWQRQRIKRLLGVVGLVSLAMAISLVAIAIGAPEERPAGRNHHQPSAHLHHRQRDSEKEQGCACQ